MKILVTGATGFIGCHVIDALLMQNHRVIATGNHPRGPEWHRLANSIEYVSCDLNDDVDFFSLFGKPESTVHLAWEGLPNFKSFNHFDKNLVANCRFLNNLVKSGMKYLTVTGTCLEYGLQEGELDEEMDTRPTTPYGLAKDTLKKYLNLLQKEVSFDLNWLRLFYIYGNGQNPNSIIPQLQKAIRNGDDFFDMSHGTQSRDYLPVEKAAEIIVKIASARMGFGVTNCCSGIPRSVLSLVEEEIKKNGSGIRLNPGVLPLPDYEPFSFWGSTKKLDTALDIIKKKG